MINFIKIIGMYYKKYINNKMFQKKLIYSFAILLHKT